MAENKKTYSEKLRDPRWQKKRLEILSRDEFTCKKCGCKETELQIHHLKYSGDPWDIDSNFLLTLCKYCHWIEEKLNYDKVIKGVVKYSKDVRIVVDQDEACFVEFSTDENSIIEVNRLFVVKKHTIGNVNRIFEGGGNG